jgi:hypothetical protein
MNNDAKDRTITINQDTLNSIEKYQNIGTIKNILRNKSVTYHNAKKIVSDIKNNKFGEGDFTMLLNTLEQSLTTMRDGINTSKTQEMESGMQNRFLSSHSKDKRIQSINNQHESVINNLKTINELLKKII